MISLEKQLLTFFDLTEKLDGMASALIIDDNISALITKTCMVFPSINAEIAALSVEDIQIELKHKTSSLFGDFLGLIDASNPWGATLLHNVQDDNLRMFLECVGYIKHQASDDFMKLTDAGVKKLVPEKAQTLEYFN